MKRFALARNIVGCSREIPISHVDFDSASRAWRAITEITLLEERFDSLTSNFLEFEKNMMESLFDFKYGGIGEGMHQMYVRRNLNRLLMNTLSAARGFIDHLPGACNRVFGENDERGAECNNKLRHAYDSSLGYRMFEALRNHSQHYGFPIQFISYGMHMDGEFPNLHARHSISPLMEMGAIRLNSSFKKTVLVELELLKNPIDLKPYLRAYIEGLARAHYRFRNLALPILEQSRTVLNDLSTRFMDAFPGNETVLGLHGVVIEDDRWLENIPLLTGMPEYAEYLSKNNVNFDWVSKGFLATALQEP